MSRRKLLLVAVGAVVLGTVAWAAFWPHPRISPEKADAIQTGMTADEVVAILGCQPGNYSGNYGLEFWLKIYGFDDDDRVMLGTSPDRFMLWIAEWQSATADTGDRPSAIAVQVRLDDRGRVACVRHTIDSYDPLSFAERSRRWLNIVRCKLGL